MDVMSFREGCLRAMPCLVVTALLWIFGGLFVLYEMILLNSQDMDTRDLLNDFRSTIGPIQAQHDDIFQPAFWLRVATNVTALSFASITESLAASAANTVNLDTTNVTCPRAATDDAPCVSATLSASSLLFGLESDYTSCHDFAAMHPTSTAALISASATSATNATLAAMLPAAPPASWNATTWESVACANWDVLRNLNCSGLVRDPCDESLQIMRFLANNNNDNGNTFNGNRPIRVRFAQRVDVLSAPISIGLSALSTSGLVFAPQSLSNGTTVADSLARASAISAFATQVSTETAMPVGGGFVPPRVGLSEAIAVNGENVTLVAMPPTAYKRHKGFGWKPPFWVHTSPCPDTASSAASFSGFATVAVDAYSVSSTMPVVRVSAPSLMATPSVATSTDFTRAQTQTFAIPAYKMQYSAPNNFADTSVSVSQLQKVKVYVTYAPLASYASSSAGAVDYTSWSVAYVEGEYAVAYTGPIPAAPFPAKAMFITVDVRDAAEPEQLTLPDFDGPIQMLYGIIVGGLGFLSSFFYFPWLFCKVYKNALHNRGMPPLFYRSSRQFRGW